METRPSTHEGTIKEIRDETSDVKSFIIDTEEFPYIPGQFVMISFHGFKDENGNIMQRPFSIATSPTEKDLMLTIKLHPEGKFTYHLFNDLKKGDKITVRGPYGMFMFKEEENIDNIVMIAAGCGIPPLRSMIRYVLDKKIKANITLFYTAREQKDIVYKDELQNVFSNNSNIKQYISLTKADDSWHGLKGRVSKELIKDNVAITDKTTFFICGPKQMIDETRKNLEDIGAKKEQIRFEGW